MSASTLSFSGDPTPVTRRRNVVTGRRTKTAASPSSTKPEWKTILTVLTKNFVLLLILVVLVRMFCRLILNQFDGNHAVLSFDYERRIAEAEELLKMIQVRIDSVDTKLDEIRADYAAASGEGGMVVKHSEPVSWRVVSSEAVKMLQPSFGEPGQCFPLKGSTGFVEIELRTAIIPTAVTLEHVAKSVAFDRSSAPKDGRVFGWLRNKGTLQMHLLAEFVYDLEKSSIQTFKVLDSGGSRIIDTIRLDFMSNHGNPTHTPDSLL